MSNKQVVLAAATACLLVFSAIAYGIYINTSSRAHVTNVRQSTASSGQVVAVGRKAVMPLLRTAVQLEPLWGMDIYSAGDGRIEQFLVKPGDKIEEGTLLAVLDSRELSAQIKQAQGTLMSAQASLEQAESELQKAKLLVQKDAISGIQLVAAQSKRDSAVGQLTNAEGALEALKIREEHTRIFAPRSGMITKRYVEVGSMARMGLALVNLAEVQELRALVSIDSTSRTVWQPQMAATLSLTGVSGEFSAQVSDVRTGPGLPAGFLLMELIIDNSKGILQPGPYSMAHIKGTVIDNAMVVPEKSVLIKGTEQYVRVLQDGRFSLRKIQTGYNSDGWTIILTGLQEGELIAINGQED